MRNLSFVSLNQFQAMEKNINIMNLNSYLHMVVFEKGKNAPPNHKLYEAKAFLYRSIFI